MYDECLKGRMIQEYYVRRLREIAAERAEARARVWTLPERFMEFSRFFSAFFLKRA